jgi:sodium-coupled monocarboxylate transporter 8/12
MGMCLMTGVSIYSTYAKCDPKLKGDIKKIDEIVPYFVIHELIDVPGMVGLFTSCIFSAVLR